MLTRTIALAVAFILMGCLSAGQDSRENAINVVQAEVASYCIALEENATQVGGYCPTCYLGSSRDTFNQSIENLTLTDLGDAYLIEVRVHLIYHWRNDLPSGNNLTFIVGKNGTLISKDIPPKRCV